MSRLVIRASDVESRSIRWAWIGRLALGYLTVVTGIEGLGKSVFAAWLIARLTRGDLPGEWHARAVDVLIVAGEDGIADTWRPRLELAGADLDRVHFLNLGGLPPDWNLRDGIGEVRAAVVEVSARMVLIDAALDHMPPPKSGEGINSPTFARQALGPLRGLVRELGLVAVFSMHPPKARSGDFRDLVQASQAFSAIPRIGLLFAYHPDDDAGTPGRRRVLLRGKGNLGRDPGALAFRVVGKPYRHDDGCVGEREVVVDVEPCAVTMADLAPDKVIGAREPTKAESAAVVIRGALSDGAWQLAAPIHKALGRRGLDSDSAVAGGSRLVGIEKRKRPGAPGGPREWRLAPAAGEAPGDDVPDGGVLEPLPAARARSIWSLGAFDSSDEQPSSGGKTPRLQDPGHTGAEESKAPRLQGYRPRGREGSTGRAEPAPFDAAVPSGAEQDHDVWAGLAEAGLAALEPEGGDDRRRFGGLGEIVFELRLAEDLGLSAPETRELLKAAGYHPLSGGGRWAPPEGLSACDRER